MKILVAEDQKDLNEIISRKLSREGYAVDSCFDGQEVLEYIDAMVYDGIVMDIMMPKMTGLGVLKEMRKKNNATPVLLLTALGSVEDRVSGLDAGADDYFVKPFDFDELLARIRAMLRRRGEKLNNIIEHRGVEINIDSHEVKRDGCIIELTAKEYSILEYLMLNIGRVLTRDNISSNIWNYDYDGGSNVVDVYMHHLRKKMDSGYEDKLITTVKGSGYIIR